MELPQRFNTLHISTLNFLNKKSDAFKHFTKSERFQSYNEDGT